VRAAGDSVELLGEVPEADLLRLFAESDFLVHPSAVEVLSATVLEALAAGLPVLGGPAVEGVVDEGTTGWTIPDADPALFVSAMRERAVQLVGDDALRRSLGERARTTAETRFAWPQIVAEHLKVYASVAKPAVGG
jgi:phosphatidylinositol alpha 1,6-mannosyltransferase